MLPQLFAILALLAMFAFLYGLWRSLSHWDGNATVKETHATDPRDELKHRLHQLMLQLRELEFEHKAGKLSPEDFQLLENKLRTDIKATMRKLDQQIAEHMEEAQRLAQSAMQPHPSPES